MWWAFCLYLKFLSPINANLSPAVLWRKLPQTNTMFLDPTRLSKKTPLKNVTHLHITTIKHTLHAPNRYAPLSVSSTINKRAVKSAVTCVLEGLFCECNLCCFTDQTRIHIYRQRRFIPTKGLKLVPNSLKLKKLLVFLCLFLFLASSNLTEKCLHSRSFSSWSMNFRISLLTCEFYLMLSEL